MQTPPRGKPEHQRLCVCSPLSYLHLSISRSVPSSLVRLKGSLLFCPLTPVLGGEGGVRRRPNESQLNEASFRYLDDQC